MQNSVKLNKVENFHVTKYQKYNPLNLSVLKMQLTLQHSA